jgi:hypothetical protein
MDGGLGYRTIHFTGNFNLKSLFVLSSVYFPQYSEKNVPQFYSVRHIFHTDCPGTESGPQWDDITLQEL